MRTRNGSGSGSRCCLVAPSGTAVSSNACLVVSNLSGFRAKHASVSSSSAEQRRYWYPPPWLAVICQVTSADPPDLQMVEVGSGGSWEPLSPCLALVVFTYSPHSGTLSPQGVPPAKPHASEQNVYKRDIINMNYDFYYVTSLRNKLQFKFD